MTPADKKWFGDAKSQLCGGSLGDHPEGGRAPLAFSAEGFLQPALPRTKTTLSETINSQENMQADKARPFSGPSMVSSTPLDH